MRLKARIALARLLGALVRPLGLVLVRSSELERLRAFGGALGPPALDPAPPEAVRDTLRPGNPRLAELKRRYAGHPATAHSVWTEGYVAAEVRLDAFRLDNAYVWQHRDGTIEAGAAVWTEPTREINYAVAAASTRSADRLGLLSRLGDDSLFGNLVVDVDGLAVSRDLIDSVLEIDFLERHLGLSGREKLTTLDIGAGYGRLPYRLAQSFPNLERAYATDAVPESTLLCDTYLRFRGVADRAIAVPLDQVEERLPADTIDVATNVHSFSEMPLAAIEWWLDLLVAKRVRHLMIVPNVGTRLVSREADGRNLDFSPALAERGLVRVAEEPKYPTASGQRFGVHPTRHHLFELARPPATRGSRSGR